MNTHDAANPAASASRRAAWLAPVIALAAFAAHARAIGHGFVDLDDGAYVTANPMVLSGLSLEGLRAAFISTQSANWHPLTWLSHMLDVSLFGLDARGHHATSVVLHALAAALAYLALLELTGKSGRSFAAAALFAVHPLRVESVAWVAERKDVLCALFFLAGLFAWARHVRTARIEWKLVALACHALALLSKPMAVTFPMLLLVLDRWPLERREAWPRLVREKLGFLALSALSCLITWSVQAAGSATGSLETFPLSERLANAVVATAIYLRETALPTGLCAFYPHPSTVSGTGAAPIDFVALALASIVLLSISWVAWRLRRERPFLAAGWLWYLGLLVPVIGLVQVGSQAHADRYTYLPQLGLWIAFVWSAAEFVARRPAWSLAARATLAALVLAFGWGSFVQSASWKDGETLYRRAIAVEPDAWLAWNNLGNLLCARGELDEAELALRRAIAIFPGYGTAHYNLGNLHMARLEREPAERAYRRSLELDPDNVDAWNNLGVALLNLGRTAEAVQQFEHALALAPTHADSLENLAIAGALSKDRARFEDACHRLEGLDGPRAAALRERYGARR